MIILYILYHILRKKVFTKVGTLDVILFLIMNRKGWKLLLKDKVKQAETATNQKDQMFFCISHKCETSERFI